MKLTCMRQIRVPLELYKAVKRYCIEHNIKLVDFYCDMLNWFFAKKQYDAYFASYKKGQILSVWLSESHGQQLKTVAKTMNVAEARIVYTALMIYAQAKGIFNYQNT